MQPSRLGVKAGARKWLFNTVLGDQLATGFFFLGGIFLLWYELCHVAAFNHTEWSAAYTVHFLLGIFFAVNIYGNWLMTFLTDVTGKGVVFPSGPTPPGWNYCDTCVANRPPRSHHCPLCETCALLRDHHCWFAGNCIGYGNHRYFFALCVHVTVLGIYCNVYNWSYVWDVKGDITFLNVLSLIFPHVMMLLGNDTLHTFLVNSASMIGFSITLVFIWLLEIQVSQLIKGQCRYERKNNIRDYDQGFWGNVEALLGHRAFLILLCPWVKSPLPGDGVNFYSQSQKVH